ncbi:MAG TPA: chromosome segregation protein, partial [Erythrobacter sp.]|nr:chromosome segregation protein [Erythrobacter sp.]
MEISRLKLSGFKSFVEPAELRVEPGLTGVVGPNGCGKSNLLEAIRWVMGENSPRSMRSGGMEDVIFAGTEARPPRDFAEVILQAKDDDGEELEVTRRIERGAGSAYRVNGRDVRAKDVALTFADAATGAHSPALVSQGKIAQVIAAKPAERRQMLEEAAGIAGLHVRRKDAESKLCQTEKNLERLEDLMAGLDSQMATLKRQAKQAERYKKLSDQIKIAEARLLYARWRDAAAAAEEAREAAKSADQRVEQVQAATKEAQKLQQAAAETVAEARDELADRRDDASAHGHRMAALTSQLEAAEQRLADLDRQKARLEEDRGDADRLTHDAAEALARLERELKASGDALAKDEERRPALTSRVDEAERASRTAELALAKATADHAGVEAEWRVVEAEIEQAKLRVARLNNDMQRQHDLRAQLSQAGDPEIAVKEAEKSANATAAKVAELRDALAQGQARKSNLQEARDDASSALAAARAELAGIEREFNALARDRDARAKGNAQGKALPKALDRISVAPGYERAIAAVLGRDAKSPLGAPKDADSGRFWTGGAAPKRVADCILAHVKNCPEQLKARLSLVHFAEKDDGRDLAPGEWIVTREGHLRRWDGFIIRGEGAAEAVRLEADNRLTELETKLPAVLKAVETTTSEDEAAREELSKLQTDLIAQERSLAEASEEERAALRMLDQAQAERERLAARFSELEQTATDLAEQLKQAESEVEEVQAKKAQLPSPDTGRASLEAAQAKHEAARSAVQSASGELAAHDQALAVARERHAAQRSEKASWEARSGEAAQRMADTAKRLEEIVEERAIMAAKPEGLMAEIEQGDTMRAKLAAELAAAEEVIAERETSLKEVERKLAEASEALSTARENRAGLRARAENEEARRGEMARISGERFQCPPPLLCERFEFEGEAVKDATQEAEEMDRLTASRERIGPVNLVAADELTRIEEEHGHNATEQAA